jgi:hypothetical protein
MKTFRTFLAILTFTVSIPIIAIADESCFTVPKLEMVAIATQLSNEVENFEEVDPNVIAQKVSERAGVNCSVDDLMSIFGGDNTVREECVQFEEFEDRFQVLSFEEQNLIEKRNHASFTSDYVNGMFNELNEIGQARFFAEEGQYIGNDALAYTATARFHVWDIETNRRGTINELLTELNNCSAQEYTDNGLDVEYGRLLSGIQNLSTLLEETSTYVKEIASLENFIINSFNSISDSNAQRACELWNSYNAAVNEYNNWANAESRSPEEIESYFNNNVQPILDEYLGFAYLCDQ